MKIFVWESVGGLVDREHNDGGVVVIARDVEQARELATKQAYDNGGSIDYRIEGEPSFQADVAHDETFVWFFPDSGCC